MKKILLLMAGIISLTFNTSGQNPKPRILGVVMGISKYQNVPSLKYADRDAMSFYNFLLSPAGGAADTNNIRLLLNEKATSYNFFEAMDNLLDMANEGDQVYIYFAGHGDIEKKTERQNGFLIGYNAPSNCYAAGGSISVRFLQDYVETLVSKNKSKVTMIIDACRSGKLAGGSQGAEITALALQAEWKGVTKILSCQPGETSLEGEQWGGGGGVFTYFMLRGMLGQADKDGDGKVSVMELNSYLDENVLRETNNKQIPEIVGDKRQEISRVNKQHALALLNQMERPISLTTENQSAGFATDVSSINDISVLKEYEKFKYYVNNNNLIAYSDSDKEKENALSLYRSLEGQRSAQSIISKMKGELLAALQNKAQISINNWMKGIQASNQDNWDSTYFELKTAFNLIDSTYTQYNQIKYLYKFWQPTKKDKEAHKKKLEECIKISPDEPIAYNDLACFYLDQNKLNDALILINKAIELSKNWSWAWSNKGGILCNMGKLEESLKSFDIAIEINPNFPESWDGRGVTLFYLDRDEEALKCYDRAIELKPELYSAWKNKAYLLGKLKKFDEALTCFDKAIQLNPQDYIIMSDKGVTLRYLGKYEEAIQSYNKAIEIKPDFYPAWYNKGKDLTSIKKFDDALECINKAIEIKQDYIDAWNFKGMTLGNLGKYDDALKCYVKVLEIKPEHLESRYNMACSYSLLKNKKEMLIALKKVIEQNPKFKSNAKSDTDFKEYWNDPDFIELVK
jgi:protein O-mannosyl-transferase